MRILLCGAGGVGKTTLVDDVRSKKRSAGTLPRIQEVARDVMRNQQIFKSDLDNIDTFLNLQKSICCEQCEREKSYKSFISDRSALDCLVYTWLRRPNGHSSNPETLTVLRRLLDEFKTDIPHLEHTIANYRTSLVVLLCPLPSFADDGVRYQLSSDDSWNFTNCFRDLLALLQIPYLYLNVTDREERVDLICKALDGKQPMKSCSLSYYKNLSDNKNKSQSQSQATKSLSEINYPFYKDKSSKDISANKTCVSIRTLCISETYVKHYWTHQKKSETNRLINNLGRFCIDDICMVQFEYSLQSSAVHNILLNGMKITGDTFFFLGCSSSGLKARKCYLLRGNAEDVKELLELNGDFDKISSISKRMARIGLLFSNVRLTDLTVENFEIISDITNELYNFTDGCGFLSSDFVDELFAVVKDESVVYPTKWRPSVFQIRYQGCKGVLQLNLNLRRGRSIQVRQSMQKFETKSHPFMGICDFSKPYSYGHLNRQYITLLSALGIDDSILLKKQSHQFELVRRMGLDFEAAVSVLHWQNKIGTASLLIRLKCSSTETCVKKSLQAAMRSDVLDKISKIQSQIVEKSEKLRIMIPKSRNMFGICDPEGILEYGECFVRITDNDKPYTVRGSVVVGKNPCYLLGDLRVLKAVTMADRPELSQLNHLVDCIVFPITGDRPHSNEIAGSDLDGDSYFITWDEELIPQRMKAPFDYPGAPTRREGNVTLPKMIEYFSQQNKTSRLTGTVDTLFKKWADIKGADSEECQRLAQIFSRVIDAGKSGERVAIPTSLLNPPKPSLQTSGKSYVWTQMIEKAKLFKEEAVRDIIKAQKSFFCSDQVTTDFVLDMLQNSERRGSTSEFDRFDFAWRHFQNITNSPEETLNLLLNHIKHINFSLFSTEEKKVAIDRGIPLSVVLNAINKSNILTKTQLSCFQLGDSAVHWNFCLHSFHDDLDWSVLLKALTQNPDTLIIFKMPDQVVLALRFSQQCYCSEKIDLTPGAVTAFLFSEHYNYSKRYVLGADYKLDLTDRILQLYCKVKSDSFLWFRTTDETVQNTEVTENDSVRNVISVDLPRFQRDILRNGHPSIRKTPFIEVEIFIQNSTVGYLDIIDGNWADIPPEMSDEDEDKEYVDEFNLDDVVATFDDASITNGTPNTLIALIEKLIRRRCRCANLAIEEKIARFLSSHIDDITSQHMFEQLKIIVSLFKIGLKHISLQLIQSLSMCALEIAELIEILKNYSNWWFLDQNTARQIIEKVQSALSIDDSTDTVNYIKHFGTLQTLTLIEEMKENKMMIKSPHETAGSISSWKVDCHPDHSSEENNHDEVDENKKTYDVTFYRTSAMAFISQLTKGQFVAIIRQADLNSLHQSASTYSCLGQIISARPSPPSVTVSLLDPINMPTILRSCTQSSKRIYWRLSNIGNITSFTRSMNALKKLCVESPLSTELLPILVHPGGHFLTSPLYRDRPFYYPESNGKDFSGLDLNPLNKSQRDAVCSVLTDKLTLIQGPPGTGKTTVACEIVRQTHRQSDIGKILVCSETNLAVDNIARKLLQHSELVLIRVGNEERVASDLYDISLEGQMRAIAAQEAKRIGFKDARGAEHRNQGLVRRLIKSADVVLTTCSGSGDPCLENEKFDLVVCDEATLTREPNLLCALVHSVRRLCLIGDPKQLGPFSLSDEATDNVTNGLPRLADLNVTLFHRLYEISNITTHMLNEQYRMHPVLMEFPSHYFYESKLVAGVTADMRRPPPFCWPKQNHPLTFIAATCGTERHRGSSFENSAEVQLVLLCLERLLAPKKKVYGERVTSSEVGVITPYLGQVRALRNHLKVRFSGVEVSTVDGFQGREKEVIIVSTVRCNDVGCLGFTNDANRINVLLTRARRGLILVGCKATLRNSEIWSQWLKQAPEVLQENINVGPYQRLSLQNRGGGNQRGHRGRGAQRGRGRLAARQ